MVFNPFKYLVLKLLGDWFSEEGLEIVFSFFLSNLVLDLVVNFCLFDVLCLKLVKGLLVLGELEEVIGTDFKEVEKLGDFVSIDGCFEGVLGLLDLLINDFGFEEVLHSLVVLGVLYVLVCD